MNEWRSDCCSHLFPHCQWDFDLKCDGGSVVVVDGVVENFNTREGEEVVVKQT